MRDFKHVIKFQDSTFCVSHWHSVTSLVTLCCRPLPFACYWNSIPPVKGIPGAPVSEGEVVDELLFCGVTLISCRWVNNLNNHLLKQSSRIVNVYSSATVVLMKKFVGLRIVTAYSGFIIIIYSLKYITTSTTTRDSSHILVISAALKPWSCS